MRVGPEVRLQGACSAPARSPSTRETGTELQSVEKLPPEAAVSAPGGGQKWWETAWDAHCSSKLVAPAPGATFPSPFSSLVWVLWAGTTYRARHRGASPSLEPTGTTPTQTLRGDKSIQSSRLIHNTATSQIRRQKGLSLSILNEALNDDPVARWPAHYWEVHITTYNRSCL